MHYVNWAYKFSSEGVYIDTIGVETQMMVVEPKANVYWNGHIQPDVSQTIHKWGKFIEAQIPEAQIPKSEFHCTMIYDSEKDEKIEQKWQEETKEQQIEIVSQYIIIGKQGAALNIPDCKFVKKWFSVSNSVPHIAKYVGKNWETKDLGPMMKKAGQSKWEPTEHPLIFHSADQDYIKILCATSLLEIPQEVVIGQKNKTLMTTTSGVINKIETELFKEVEQQIPTELWSQHDTDIGLITSANAIRVQLKPDARLPRKAQYPLHPDAEVGIKNTIEGLVKAGVLIETTSYCNTPILPVIKADKNR